jgi:excinuclease ABC subunit A
MTDQITIRGARLHNLKNVSISIPKNRLVVLTGVSGSGKSTLGFDILFKEGLRQYIEAAGMVTFGLARPPVESIRGLAPTISVDQRLTNHSPRSTVGTATEVYTYLRVLYARLGKRPCPRCGIPIPPAAGLASGDWETETGAGEPVVWEAVESVAGAAGGADEEVSTEESFFPCTRCGTPVPELTMAHFSFNKPEGACPECTGLGRLHQADLPRLVDESKSLAGGAVTGWNAAMLDYQVKTLQAASEHYGLAFDPALPVRDYSPALRDLLFFGVESPHFRRHFPTREPPATVRLGRFEGVASNLLRRYAERIQDPEYREKMEELLVIETCPACAGTRLKPESRAVTVAGRSIVEAARLPLTGLDEWLAGLPGGFSPDEMRLAEPVLADLHERIRRLVEAGAGYLALERGSPSLSAGESQRLRMASLLGSELTGLLYVFDEPTIGLHQRDTQRMIGVLRRLRDLGNTVLVIEHDLETIAAADHVIDFGPGAGRHGGQVVAAGTPEEIAAQPGSLTGAYLAGRASIPVPERRRPPGEPALTIRGARHNNLQNLTVRIPLGLLVAVTGVSGSGKSSLVFDVLDRALRRRLIDGGQASGDAPGEHDAIEGIENLERVITIDQEHIGRIPRSNAATYSEAFTPIRQAFAATPEALNRGLTARHFSFNVSGGRCERCQGAGLLAVKMHFMPDVEVTCPSCKGRRFTRETLSARYHDYDIAQALDLTVNEALALFADVPAAASRLKALSDVGLGYLQLGQPATTLSGGEAQRVKLARELGRRTGGRTLYLLDEPTTGLHLADAARLLGVLQRLVEAGNSVVLIEHNLELVKTADWVIDLGPEGGAAGGKLVAEGTPEQVAAVAESYTGQGLKRIMGRG